MLQCSFDPCGAAPTEASTISESICAQTSPVDGVQEKDDGARFGTGTGERRPRGGSRERQK